MQRGIAMHTVLPYLLFGVFGAVVRHFRLSLFPIGLYANVVLLAILISVVNWKSFHLKHHFLNVLALMLGLGLGLLVFLSTSFAEVWMDEMTGEKVHEPFIIISLAMGLALAQVLILPIADKREKILQALLATLILYVVSFLSLDLFIRYPLFDWFIIFICFLIGLAINKDYTLQRLV